MKKSVLILAITCIAFSLAAQKPLATFFSEDGYKFWVIIDGKKMNDEPAFRVENLELDNEWAKARIIFEDPKLKPIDKTIQGVDVDGNVSSVTWVIKQTGKGKFKVNASSWKPVDKESRQTTTVETLTVQSEKSIPEPATEEVTTVSTSAKTEEVVASEISMASGTDVFSMKVNIDDGQSASRMDVNISIPNLESVETQTSEIVVSSRHEDRDIAEVPAPTEKHEPLPGYNGRIGCEHPMSSERFPSVKNSVSSKDFESTKLTVAKQVINSNCLLVSQVIEIINLFDFESTKLEFAKEAYGRTYDIDNYYQVNDVFDFESSIRDLNNYIQKK